MSRRARRLLGVGLAGLLVAVGVDGLVYRFVQFGGRAKAAECRAALPPLLQRLHALDGGPGVPWGPLGAQPRRYTYVIGTTGDDEVLPTSVALGPAPAWRSALPVPSGAAPGRSDAGLTVVCVGDLDGDEGVDAWSVSDFPRRVGEATVEPFTVLHELDDFPAYRPAPVRWWTEPPTHEILIPLTRGTPAAALGPG